MQMIGDGENDGEGEKVQGRGQSDSGTSAADPESPVVLESGVGHRSPCFPVR